LNVAINNEDDLFKNRSRLPRFNYVHIFYYEAPIDVCVTSWFRCYWHQQLNDQQIFSKYCFVFIHLANRYNSKPNGVNTIVTNKMITTKP